MVKETDGIKTMSSLDMVAYINATRKPGEAELRHDTFMDKVPKVLGIEAIPKFSGMATWIANGATRNRVICNFPRREAMLMAMSYSYDLQATVFDAWEAAEAKLAAPTVAALPTTYLDALKQLVASVEVNERQVIE